MKYFHSEAKQLTSSASSMSDASKRSRDTKLRPMPPSLISFLSGGTELSVKAFKDFNMKQNDANEISKPIKKNNCKRI
jgi:hypothetical protein